MNLNKISMLQCAVQQRTEEKEHLLPCTLSGTFFSKHCLVSIRVYDPPPKTWSSTIPPLIYEESFYLDAPSTLSSISKTYCIQAKVYNGPRLRTELDVPFPTYRLDYNKRSVLHIQILSSSKNIQVEYETYRPLFIPPSGVSIPIRHLSLPPLPKPPLSIHYCGPHELCLQENCPKLHAPSSSCLNGLYPVLCTNYLLSASGCRKGSQCTYLHFGDGLDALSTQQLRDLKEHHAALQQAIKFSSL